MASNQPSRSGHLDASGGRTIVFCHACHHEWYQDEYGQATCPRCTGDIVEIVTPENDPRAIYEDEVPGSSTLGSHSHHRHDDFSDPEEADIEEQFHTGPGFILHERVFGQNQNQNQSRNRNRNRASRTPQPPPRDDDADHIHDPLHDPLHDHDHRHEHGRPMNPDDDGAVFRRFFDMLNSFGLDRMASPEMFGGPQLGGPGGGGIRQTTYTSGDGSRISSISFTATIGGPGRASSRVGGPPMPFGPYADPLPRTRAVPRITLVSIGPRANQPPRNFRDVLGGLGPPPGWDADREGARGRDRDEMPVNLGTLLGLLANPANARHGDAVYTQEALDRIISALMEANPQSNAAPPATEDALSKLERKKVDEKLLAAEGGKMECTICIDNLKVGEEVVHLPCKHVFHDQCVTMWLKEHNTCPICRTPIEENADRSNSESSSRRGQASGQQGDPQAGSSERARRDTMNFPFNFMRSPREPPGPSAQSQSQTGRGSPFDIGRNRDMPVPMPMPMAAPAEPRPRDYALRRVPPEESQAALHESIQNLTRLTAERRRNRPVSTLHESPTTSYLRPRRNSLSPPHSHSPDPSRTRARSPSSQSRRSGASDQDGHRDPGSRAMGWLRDHWPGRRDERRQS